ncbi:nickel pincer cofactor biosynthesis protein LarC [Methanofollis fontis]|uniref:TIGR00299 family protein n=1 Tax=Methanofollis fontis TaxID=2052832 RepID=A0A483CYY5_9EURY|nr:nickel pincer cofactor biosynthesis protein LarC [Methanofollis fontis]TAJ45492.1 TIGR00299 family protein [Methanofollis fontis]
MRALLIDPRGGGISGDMLAAALADLTGSAAPLEHLGAAIAALPGCEEFSVGLEEVDGGVRARRLAIRLREKPAGSDGDLAAALADVAASVGLSTWGRERAGRVLADLLAAERRLHPSGFSRHAVASADTIFDILAPLLLMEESGLSRCPVLATPPALGGGEIRTGGGTVGGPAPAALEICAAHHIPVAESPLTMELTTPTGAALLANLAVVADRFPAMTPVRTGYGAGTRPNGNGVSILRVVEGEVSDLVEERIVMLETNLDDISGEVVAHALGRLLEEGATDAFITPAIGKKNRPVQVLTVNTDREHFSRLLGVLMEETGTLGVRVREEPRLVADRRREALEIPIGGRTFLVRVKTSRACGRVIAVKPEYEDMRQIARELGISLREVAWEVERHLPGPGA